MQLRGSGFVVLGVWWIIAIAAAAGVWVMAFVDIRAGGRLLAGSFLVGAAIRSVARPDRRAGGLNVRSRFLDTTVLLALGIALLVAVETVRLPSDPEPPQPPARITVP